MKQWIVGFSALAFMAGCQALPPGALVSETHESGNKSSSGSSVASREEAGGVSQEVQDPSEPSSIGTPSLAPSSPALPTAPSPQEALNPLPVGSGPILACSGVTCSPSDVMVPLSDGAEVDPTLPASNVEAIGPTPEPDVLSVIRPPSFDDPRGAITFFKP